VIDTVTNIATQFATISDKMAELDAPKLDTVVQLTGVEFQPSRQVSFNYGGAAVLVTPEPRAWGQLLRRFSDVRGVRFDPDFMLREDVVGQAEFATIMNDNLHQLRGQRQLADWLFRLDGNNVRAVMTNRYGAALSNNWLWDSTMTAWKNSKFGAMNISAKNMVLDRDTMQIDIEIGGREVRINRGGQEYWAIGVRLFNNEVGSGKLCVLPWMKRTACDNSKVFDTSEAACRATHLAPKVRSIQMAVWESLAHAFETGFELLDAVQAQTFEEIPNYGDVLDSICERNGWDKTVLFDMMRGSENRSDRFGLSNALSFAGTHSEDLSVADRMKLQSAAARVLVSADESARLVKRLALTTTVIEEED
jgi:hypothetical protein